MEIAFQNESITLYHGDALDLLQSLSDKSIDMIFTDPPYGHNNNNGDLISRWEQALGQGISDEQEIENRRPIANDGPEADELVQTCFHEFYRILKPSSVCCCCCCGGGGPDPQFARWSLWLDDAFKGGFKQMVVWDKGPMGMGWHYRRSYETVLVAQKGNSCRWYGGKKIENIIRPGAHGINKIIPSSSQHPTEKPAKVKNQPPDLTAGEFNRGE